MTQRHAANNLAKGYLSHSQRLPLTVQKVIFGKAKDGLSHYKQTAVKDYD